MSRLSVVLPAYNEELMVGKTAGFFMRFWQKPGFRMSWFLWMMDLKIIHGKKY